MSTDHTQTLERYAYTAACLAQTAESLARACVTIAQSEDQTMATTLARMGAVCVSMVAELNTRARDAVETFSAQLAANAGRGDLERTARDGVRTAASLARIVGAVRAVEKHAKLSARTATELEQRLAESRSHGG